MMKIAKHLATKIGPRVSGTPQESAASRFILKEFQKLRLDCRVQPFRYLGWLQKIKPSLTVLSPFKKALQVAPVAYSGSTPREGIEGTLRYFGNTYLFPRLMEPPKYAILSDSGENLGFVIVQPGTRSKPIPNQWLHIIQQPMILVCEEQFAPVVDAISTGKMVRVCLKSVAKYVQDIESYNVIAKLQGPRKDTIIIGGHHDSIEGSPGAIDNASGVEAIFRVAEKMMKRKSNHSFEFITWGGHEWGLFGSQYYAKTAREQGTIKNIKACLTLDVLGCGDYLWIWAGPKRFRKLVEDDLKRSKLALQRELRFEGTLIGSDDYNFSAEGIAHAMLMDWPAPNLHLPEDTYDRIEEDKVEFGVQVALRMVQMIEKQAVKEFSNTIRAANT
jgi:aminopeptidase YwaD